MCLASSAGRYTSGSRDMSALLAEKKQIEMEDFGAQLAKKKTAKDKVDAVEGDGDACGMMPETGLCRAAMPK